MAADLPILGGSHDQHIIPKAVVLPHIIVEKGSASKNHETTPDPLETMKIFVLLQFQIRHRLELKDAKLEVHRN